ncbi:amidohydrolase family protein [Streptomyces sp. NA04227]|uniref:N-acyl-D-amino-acid deacylase family protein n=1 Tax=Streptomyces sp. NA04227 TaxID=2742136 RepID=UPI00159150B5|nr:amidohydrolase family protein [Streptomyces sp. NA04227]QKW06099.1 amidohydrolase family protein [Streptomyces sp. NA04227]
MAELDLIVTGGLWFDGTGSAPLRRELGVRDGVLVEISTEALPVGPDTTVLDARGKWVTPGFLDIHTHYDAEVLALPGLTESVRHGVTTVVLGNCSLSTVTASDDECADIFSRVEAVPRESVMSILNEHRDWATPAEYARHLDGLPLGPNTAAFLGHSDIRVHTLGLGRSVTRATKPTGAELRRMTGLLEDALDEGFLGLSSMTNTLDKIDGEAYRSRSLPSTYARSREFKALNEVLRSRGRILQSAPNISLTPNIAKFFAASSGLFGRRPLRTSLLSAADSKAYPFLVHFMLYAAPLLNRFAGTDFKWQHLPVPFKVYADGIDLVVFEEFGAGAAALHLRDEVERDELLQQESFRRQFRKEYDNKLTPRIWHRNLHDAHIVACPEANTVGKTFGQVADERGLHPIDAFLDLVVLHGRKVRWHTTVANDRPRYADKLAANPGVQMGFGDAGAHLRNMAFYNYHLRLLKRVHEARGTDKPFLSPQRAVHRLTGELGEWYGLDAGFLRRGDRADLAIIDPERLDASVDELHENAVPAYGGLRRLVNRNDATVTATVINGQVAWRDGEFTEGFGTQWGSGQFLRVGTRGRTGSAVDGARGSRGAATARTKDTKSTKSTSGTHTGVASAA